MASTMVVVLTPLSDKEYGEFNKRRQEADKEIEKVKAKIAEISTGQQEQENVAPKLGSASKVKIKVSSLIK